jgi:hypothetical protein
MASTLAILRWAEPKPFPTGNYPPAGGKVQIWWATSPPRRYPSAEELSKELLQAMRRQPNCADRWIPAVCIEKVIYPNLCKDLGWPPRPWLGRAGVASHFGKLARAKYMRAEVDGQKQNLLHYFIQTGEVVPLRRP